MIPCEIVKLTVSITSEPFSAYQREERLIDQEISLLINNFQAYGRRGGEPGLLILTFGELLNIYGRESDLLPAMLLRAKNYKLLKYENVGGHLLISGEHNMIQLVLDLKHVNAFLRGETVESPPKPAMNKKLAPPAPPRAPQPPAGLQIMRKASSGFKSILGKGGNNNNNNNINYAENDDEQKEDEFNVNDEFTRPKVGNKKPTIGLEFIAQNYVPVSVAHNFVPKLPAEILKKPLTNNESEAPIAPPRKGRKNPPPTKNINNQNSNIAAIKRDSLKAAKQVLSVAKVFTGNMAKQDKRTPACDNYRVDVTAATFGNCKCGYPKAAHAKIPKPKPQTVKKQLPENLVRLFENGPVQPGMPVPKPMPNYGENDDSSVSMGSNQSLGAMSEEGYQDGALKNNNGLLGGNNFAPPNNFGSPPTFQTPSNFASPPSNFGSNNGGGSNFPSTFGAPNNFGGGNNFGPGFGQAPFSSQQKSQPTAPNFGNFPGPSNNITPPGSAFNSNIPNNNDFYAASKKDPLDNSDFYAPAKKEPPIAPPRNPQTKAPQNSQGNLERYEKMMRAGVPTPQIEQAMRADGVDPSLLNAISEKIMTQQIGGSSGGGGGIMMSNEPPAFGGMYPPPQKMGFPGKSESPNFRPMMGFSPLDPQTRPGETPMKLPPLPAQYGGGLGMNSPLGNSGMKSPFSPPELPTFSPQMPSGVDQGSYLSPPPIRPNPTLGMLGNQGSQGNMMMGSQSAMMGMMGSQGSQSSNNNGGGGLRFPGFKLFG